MQFLYFFLYKVYAFMLLYGIAERKTDADPLIRVLSGRKKERGSEKMRRVLAVFLMLAILLTGLTVTANAATTG